MTKPIVGLTLNFRDAPRTLRCIESLLVNGAAHVVVWDNSDDEGASADSLVEHLAGHEKVTLLVSPANLGFAAGVNRGVAWIEERFGNVWVALINNDAEFLPGALELLSEALEEQSRAILVCPSINNGGRITGPAYYQRWLGVLSSKEMPGSEPHASGCAMLIAVSRLNQPLFDESFFMYGEDAELGWRLVRSGQSFTHVPHVLVYHEGSASSGMGSEFYETRMVAAHFLLAKKLARGRLDFGVLILARFLTLTARACLRAWRYQSGLPLRALAGGWRIFCGDDPLMRRARSFYEPGSERVLSSSESKSIFSSAHAASTEMPAMQGTGSPDATL